MIIRLTHYQARVVMARIPDLHREAMGEHRTVHGPKAHAYDLPAIAWRQIRDHLWLNPAYYGPLGGKLGSQPKALYRAIQIIHTAVMEMERHPALENRAALGGHMQVIPAFVGGALVAYGDDACPYPAPGAGFVLLLPQIRGLHGEQFTEWFASPVERFLRGPGWSWTYEPAPHLAFDDFRVESHTPPPSISWG